ncbi:MAG: trypsin-like peptidase domain-containing protein [Gammaproteobacteria bacterium]
MSTQGSAQALAAFSDDLANIVERVGASVVALQARRSNPASAVVLEPGIVATAAHTLRREEGITAVLADGSASAATLVGVDPGTDIAVLRLESSQGAAIEFGDAAAARPGHFVVAVSRGTDGSLSASAGIVARTGGEWRTWRGGHVDRLVQLDGGLWAGFSGGPVVDARGGVIGIGTSALSRGRAVVIPGSVLKRVSAQLLARGHVSHAYIGAAVQSVEVPEALRAQLGISQAQGLIVISTVPQGPADVAGIALGDTLLTLDGKPLADVDDLKAALGADRIGKPVAVSLIRAKQLVNADVVIGERPQGRC